MDWETATITLKDRNNNEVTVPISDPPYVHPTEVGLPGRKLDRWSESGSSESGELSSEYIEDSSSENESGHPKKTIEEHYSSVSSKIRHTTVETATDSEMEGPRPVKSVLNRDEK